MLISITEEELKRLVKEAIAETMAEKKSFIYEGILDEMPQFNYDEPLEDTPLPSTRFKLEINSFDHNPPHVHVYVNNAEKNMDYECTFRINDGSVLRLISKRLENSKIHRFVRNNFPKWLSMKTIAPPKTNREFCLEYWKEQNPNQEIKWY